MALIAGIPVVSWVINRCAPVVATPDAIGLGWEHNGKIVAGVMYEEYTEASIHATIAVESGSVIQRGFLWAMFDYPFGQMGVKKIIVQISSANEASENLAMHLGFTLEARIKDAYLDGDRLIYTMTKDNCRWLGDSHEKEISETSSAA